MFTSNKNQETIGKRNIIYDYLFCFLRNFSLTEAVWVLYLGYKGIPLWQIGILEGIFHISSILFEIPSGIMADLLGRKNVMILGRVSDILSAVLMIYSVNFIGFAAALILTALSYNLNSGSEEAFLYDSCKIAGMESSYLKISSRWSGLIEVSITVATFIGGILTEKTSYELCYFFTLLVAVISLMPLFFLKEPSIESASQKNDLQEHLKESLYILKKTPEILKILLFYPAISAFYTTVYFYSQEYLVQMGLDKIQISIVYLVLGGASCLGALCSAPLFSRLKTKIKFPAALSIGCCILLTGTGRLLIVLPALVMTGFMSALLEPVKSASLNRLIPSEQRATILSVESMFFSAFMILFFPLSGFIATFHGLHTAFIVLGICLLLFSLMSVPKQRGHD